MGRQRQRGGAQCDRPSLSFAASAFRGARCVRRHAVWRTRQDLDGMSMGSPGPHAVQPLPDKPHFGKPISEADIAAWNIDIRTPDGQGLPAGPRHGRRGQDASTTRSARPATAPTPRAARCTARWSAASARFKHRPRVLTPGSMYPYAPILFDYIRRAMPMDQPQIAQQRRGLRAVGVPAQPERPRAGDAVMDARSLRARCRCRTATASSVDDRPDTQAKRCMTNCK